MINWGIVKNPLNWLTVGIMSAFFLLLLREVLRLFETGDAAANKA